jgi:TIR domain
MMDSPSVTTGRVFISYRREETAYAAGWLYERLVTRLGEGKIFKDVDSIELGEDFVEAVTAAVGSCDVLLALIGDEWLTVKDEMNHRRIDDPDDFVRLEIEAALARDVRVIPVLVDGAAMPHADELPGSLAALVRRQALELSPDRFYFDTGRLLEVLERTLVETQAQRAIHVPAPAALTVWTEQDPTTQRRNPTTDAIRQMVSDLSLPGNGNSFLVIQRHDREESYAQTARNAADDYVAEYQEGGTSRHYTVSHLSMRAAQAAICGWALDLPGWRDRVQWSPLTAADATAQDAKLGRRRDPIGRWVRAKPRQPTVGARQGRDPGVLRRPSSTPPLESSKPTKEPRRRLSTRGRILTIGSVIAIAILLVVVINVRTNSSDQTLSGTNEVLEDDLSDESWGWMGTGGSYNDGMYRIELDPRVGQHTSVPRDQGGVYPFAAEDLRINVDARSLTALDDNSGYGVVCRLDNEANKGYLFNIGNGRVGISKRVGRRSWPLRQVDIAIDPTAVNPMQVECTNDSADQLVHLVFDVHGQRIEARDAGTVGGPPLLEGTVGMLAGTGGGIPIKAEFDNVVVQPI